MTPAKPRLRLTPPPPPRESAIQRSILEALRWEKDAAFWRNSTGAFRQEKSGRLYFFGLGVGSADIVGVVKTSGGVGRFVALECKREGGKLTSEQEMWLARVREAGGFACVVRSSREAQQAVLRARNGESQ